MMYPSSYGSSGATNASVHSTGYQSEDGGHFYNRGFDEPTIEQQHQSNCQHNLKRENQFDNQPQDSDHKRQPQGLGRDVTHQAAAVVERMIIPSDSERLPLLEEYNSGKRCHLGRAQSQDLKRKQHGQQNKDEVQQSVIQYQEQQQLANMQEQQDQLPMEIERSGQQQQHNQLQQQQHNQLQQQQHNQLQQQQHNQLQQQQQQHNQLQQQQQQQQNAQQEQEQVEQRPNRYFSKCNICVIGTFLTVLLGCVGLAIYTGVTFHQINSEKTSVWLSTTENASLSHLMFKDFIWYDSICIKKVDEKHIQNYLKEVKISLVHTKNTCKNAMQTHFHRHINGTPFHGHKLSLFLTAETSIHFEMNLTLDDKHDDYFTIYIIYTHDQLRECDHPQGHPGKPLLELQFNTNGSNSNNVNCTTQQNNNVAICSSSMYVIPKTRRYQVCMHTPKDINSHIASYHLRVSGKNYDLSDTRLSERKQCYLNETHCCIVYSTFQEMFEPTCTFIQNTAINSDMKAHELSFPLVITSHGSLQPLIGSCLFVMITSILLVMTLLCVVGRIRYRTKHLDQYCVELKIAGHACLQL